MRRFFLMFVACVLGSHALAAETVLLDPAEFSQTHCLTEDGQRRAQECYLIVRHQGADALGRPIPAAALATLPSRTGWDRKPLGGVVDRDAQILPSFVQHEGNRFGLYMSLEDLTDRRLYQPVRGGGPHVVVGKDFATPVLPWAQPGGGLRMGVWLRVPYVDIRTADGRHITSGGTAAEYPVGQVSLGFYLHDTSDPKQDRVLAYVVLLYESRGPHPEGVGDDTYTMFISTQVRRGAKYVEPEGDSAELTGHPFAELRHYAFRLSAEKLRVAIADVNEQLRRSRDGKPETELARPLLGEDVTKYRVSEVLLLFEMPNYVVNAWNNTGIGFQDLRASIGHEAGG